MLRVGAEWGPCVRVCYSTSSSMICLARLAAALLGLFAGLAEEDCVEGVEESLGDEEGEEEAYRARIGEQRQSQAGKGRGILGKG